MNVPATHNFVDGLDHRHLRWTHVQEYPYDEGVLSRHEPRFKFFEAVSDIARWLKGWRW